MEVEIDNRLKCCPDTCPYAEISTYAEEYKTLGGTCMVEVTIKCEHGETCKYVGSDE